MNKELLQEVAKRIVAAPATFDMSAWTWQGERSGETPEACGTTACIAGEACILAGKAKWKMHPTLNRGYYSLAPDRNDPKDAGSGWSWSINAQQVLDISRAEANRLFYTSSWPEKFKRGYHDTDDPKVRACVAAARIRHFMATDGAE